MPRAVRPLALLPLALAAALVLGAAPAAARVTIDHQHGTLVVAGDRAANAIALLVDPNDPGFLLVGVGEDGTTDFRVDRATFTSIELQGREGRDDLRVDPTFSGLLDEPITVHGGPGNDTITGGANSDTLFGDGGDDTFDPNRGTDVVSGGDGDDRVMWDPGDGSDLIEGNEGTDTLEFHGSNAAEHIALTADGEFAHLARDVADVNTDLLDVEHVSVSTLGSADVVTVGDLTGTSVTRADVDAGGADGAADTVIAQGTPAADHVSVGASGGATTVSGLAAQTRVTGAEPTEDVVDVQALGGDDTFAAGVHLIGLRAVQLDGGEGTDALTYSGTNGDDAIDLALDGALPAIFTSGTTLAEPVAVEATTIKALEGQDAVLGQPGLAGLTSLVIQGGPGNDVLRGGDGADEIVGGGGDDVLDGNRGNDRELGGDGADVFQWDPGDGSDALAGQGGAGDELDFDGSNASESIELSANGTHAQLTRDVAAVGMDIAGIDLVHVAALGSPDTITVDDLAGTGVRDVDVDLGGFGGTGNGDAAADTVNVNGTAGPDTVDVSIANPFVVTRGLAATTRVFDGEPALDTLHVATLGGDDTVTVAPDVADFIAPVVDLGADEGP